MAANTEASAELSQQEVVFQQILKGAPEWAVFMYRQENFKYRKDEFVNS